MNLLEIISPGIAGLLVVLIFLGLIVVFTAMRWKEPKRNLREISAFARLDEAIGQAVEAGKRLHVSLGWGGVNGIEGASAVVGLSVLRNIGHLASVSDRPPVATSGEGTLAILSRDTLQSAFDYIGAPELYDPTAGQLTGLTPFAYASGTLPTIFDENVSASILAGHFGSEVALITDAGERSASLTLGGSDSLPAQAVMYASAQEPLIGEELYASSAYIHPGPVQVASLRAQDVLRWLVVAAILAGVVLKLAGAL